MLSAKTLFNAWQYALDNIRNKAKDPHEDEKAYVARCWVMGIIQSLNKEGYTVCIKKDSVEQVLLP